MAKKSCNPKGLKSSPVLKVGKAVVAAIMNDTICNMRTVATPSTKKEIEN